MLFEQADKALRLFEEIAARQEQLGLGRNPKLRTFRVVMGGLLAKSVKTLQAIALLCDSGWTGDALVLLRALFEGVVDAAFLRKHREWGVYLYLEDSVIRREKMAGTLADKPELARLFPELAASIAGSNSRFRKASAEERERLRRQYGSRPPTEPLFWTKGREPRRWRHFTFRGKCVETGCEHLYYTLYSLASAEAHPSAQSLVQRHVGETSQGPLFRAAPADQDLAATLSTAVAVFLRMLTLFNDAFKVGASRLIQRAERDLRRAVKTHSPPSGG
jgi:hypothetical protein